MEKSKIWITIMGWSPMAAFNTIWAFKKKYNTLPNEYYILYSPLPRFASNINKIKDWLRFLGPYDALHQIPLENESLEEFTSKIYQVLKPFINAQDPPSIYLDMTSGRKFMSMIIALVGLKHQEKISAVYYNYLTNDDYYDELLPLIPKFEVNILDILQYSEILLNTSVKTPLRIMSKEELMDIISWIMCENSPKSLSRTQILRALEGMLIQCDRTMLNDVIGKMQGLGYVKTTEINENNQKFQAYAIHKEKLTPARLKSLEDFSTRYISNNSCVDIIPMVADISKVLKPLEIEQSVNTCYLSERQLMLILNELHDCNYRSIRIEAAPFGLHLADVEIGEKIVLHINPQPFTEQNPKITAESIKWEKEVDFKNSWYDLLIMSGIIQIENADEIKSKITTYGRYNPLKGELPTVIALDTNLYRNRFFQFLQSYLISKENASRIGFLLSETVRDEMSFPYKYKTEQEDLANLIPSLHGSKIKGGENWLKILLSDFINQNKYYDRQKRLGFQDFNHCLQEEICFWGDKSDVSSSQDNMIVQELKGFIRKHDFNLFLLSNDKDFIDLASGIPKMTPFLVTYPSKKRVGTDFIISWNALIQYLYCASVWYGGILLGDNDKEIYEPILLMNGIWRGKESDDWQQLKVKIGGANAFIDRIKRDLNVIKKFDPFSNS